LGTGNGTDDFGRFVGGAPCTCDGRRCHGRPGRRRFEFETTPPNDPFRVPTEVLPGSPGIRRDLHTNLFVFPLFVRARTDTGCWCGTTVERRDDDHSERNNRLVGGMIACAVAPERDGHPPARPSPASAPTPTPTCECMSPIQPRIHTAVGRPGYPTRPAGPSSSRRRYFGGVTSLYAPVGGGRLFPQHDLADYTPPARLSSLLGPN